MQRLLQLLYIVAIALTIPATPLFAEIYKSVDENGNVIYTDVPGGKKVDEIDLPTINTQPPTQRNRSLYYPENNDEPDLDPNYSVSISSPANGAEIPPGQRNLSVSAATSPKLKAGHSMQLIWNGAPTGRRQQSSAFVIPEIYRGSHQISVVVFNRKGEEIARSTPVNVNVIRPIIKRNN